MIGLQGSLLVSGIIHFLVLGGGLWLTRKSSNEVTPTSPSHSQAYDVRLRSDQFGTKPRLPAPVQMSGGASESPSTGEESDYLTDARVRIESRFPARFSQPIHDALARQGGPLRTVLLLEVDPQGTLLRSGISQSSGAAEVDALLLSLARQVERFLPTTNGKAFQFVVPLEIYRP